MAFTFVGFRAASLPHIELHSKHRIYVPRGQLALALRDVEPLMLEPGLHNVDCPRFTFVGLRSATEPYLNVGSMHRVFVAAGSVALVLNEGVGEILEETGVRTFDSALFEFKGLRPAVDQFMRVGAATRIIVPAGSLGKLNVNGVATLLPPGVHKFREQSLRYDGAVDATTSLIVHGNLKRLLVQQGTWGITYDDGALTVLQPGLHELFKPSHAVAGSLSRGIVVVSLKDICSMTAGEWGVWWQRKRVGVATSDSHAK
jgi:hypothetical protein